MKSQSLELLCFQVGPRVFAMDIMGIREILRSHSITAVPRSPAEILGVLNLRGDLVTVLDLHQVLLGMPREGGDEEPKLVVVRACGRKVGLLVDRVIEVVSVPLVELRPVPAGTGAGGDTLVAAFRRNLEGTGENVVLLVRLGALVAMTEPELRRANP